MTNLHPDDLVEHIDRSQIGVLCTAIDVHRRAQIRKRDRTSDPTIRAEAEAEANDLTVLSNFFKNLEMRLMQDER